MLCSYHFDKMGLRITFLSIFKYITETRKILRVHMVLGDAISKLETLFCIDLEPCFKVHNLAVIQLKNTKFGQMTNFKVVFHMVVLFYKFDKIGNSTQSHAQTQSGQYITNLLNLRTSDYGVIEMS